jgi:GrpB-like predicted nucleotidyltransferase (UPF0157 family)
MERTFSIVAVRHDEVARRFASLQATVLTLLAASTPPLQDADIQHIGSTAVPGCLTKGDLDLCVRVPPEHFARCEAALADALARNEGSLHTSSLASFIAHPGTAHEAGIQLVAMGSPEDTFVRFRDLLLASPKLVEHYNALKLAWHGKPMDDYRDAKAAFIDAALANPPREPSCASNRTGHTT